jgi:hypothetical protein
MCAGRWPGGLRGCAGGKNLYYSYGEVVVDGQSARIIRVPVGPTRGQRLVNRLCGTATAHLNMSTDELMALLRDDD